jgi:hypothetical protein
MNWKKKQLIGFSVKSMEQMIRAISLGANMVEIRLGDFEKNGTPLYFYHQKKFELNERVLWLISAIAHQHSVEVQFHLPLEKDASLDYETGINIGILAHHEVELKRFRMLEQIYGEYEIGSVITVHPPLTFYRGEQYVSEEDALRNAKIFFDKLDKVRIANGCLTRIGLENQADVKSFIGKVGYLPRHFREMLLDTRTIGITVDTGHRRLAKEFTVTEFIQLGLQVENFHFHGNRGIIDPESYDDDEHLLPNKDNVKGYYNFLRYFRRHRTPVVLEIIHLNSYKDELLSGFVEKLKKELE